MITTFCCGVHVMRSVEEDVPNEFPFQAAVVGLASDVDIAHDLTRLLGFDPRLPIVEGCKGITVAAEGEIDSLRTRFLEISKHVGAVRRLRDDCDGGSETEQDEKK